MCFLNKFLLVFKVEKLKIGSQTIKRIRVETHLSWKNNGVFFPVITSVQKLFFTFRDWMTLILFSSWKAAHMIVSFLTHKNYIATGLGSESFGSSVFESIP